MTEDKIKPAVSIRAMAFDPKFPSSLLLSSKTLKSSKEKFVTFRADDGIGCNAEETSALMGLLDARDDYIKNGKCNSKSLNALYRRELVTCIVAWETRFRNGGTEASAKEGERKEDELLNLELLRMTHTIAHLSEIFLLQDLVGEDPNKNTAGIVTSNTVRYLRWNHIDDATETIQTSLPADMDINGLLSLNQPEYFVQSTSNEHNVEGLTPYWLLLRKLVLHGRLNEAWSVLSNHSACRRCARVGMDNKDNCKAYMDPSVEEDAEAFGLIESLLLSAPLPGGRDVCNDTFGENVENDALRECVNGIPLSAYRLWDDNTNNGGDLWGEGFNFHAAMSYYKAWKASLSQMVKSNVYIQNLTRRLPMLHKCLWNILLGTSITYTEDDSWSERLVGELLYTRPNIKKEDMHVRAKAAMKTCITGDKEAIHLQEIIVSVMRGNTGSVVRALHGLGGGSGAALPATMLALLCNIFAEISIIEAPSLSYDLPTEFLLSASSAILSSFTTQNHADTGVSLSTRLLQPYIKPKNVRICAHVAESLERHRPKSDAEAMILLKMCRDTLCRGSRRIMDACDSLSFSRHIYYKETGKIGLSTYWLLRGVECASLFGTKKEKEGKKMISSTSCFRHIVNACYQSSLNILKALVDDSLDEQVSLQVKGAQNMVQVITEDEASHIVLSNPSIVLLQHVLKISHNMFEGDRSQIALGITKCLEEQINMDGTVTTLANPTLYGYFFSIAFDILAAEDSMSKSEKVTASFNVHAIHTMMSRYAQFCSMNESGLELDSIRNVTFDDITKTDIHESFGKGLMRAFIVENAEIRNSELNLTATSNLKRTYVNVQQDSDLLLGPSM